MSLLALLVLTMTACVSKSEVHSEIILPPMPERTEQKEPETMQDIANLLNYYEHLIQKWELWGAIVSKMVEDPSLSGK